MSLSLSSFVADVYVSVCVCASEFKLIKSELIQLLDHCADSLHTKKFCSFPRNSFCTSRLVFCVLLPSIQFRHTL